MTISAPFPLESTCPHCGKRNEAQSALNGRRAPMNDGSLEFSLCMSCGNAGVFVHGPLGVYVRLPTPLELAQVVGTVEYRAWRKTWDLFAREGRIPD